LIVSDNLGYELIREMTTGISFNKTICNVIIVKNGNDTDELKGLLEKEKITVKVVDDIGALPEVAKEEYTRAKHERQDWTKKQLKKNLKDMKKRQGKKDDDELEVGSHADEAQKTN
jgi:hypothetical protein